MKSVTASVWQALEETAGIVPTLRTGGTGHKYHLQWWHEMHQDFWIHHCILSSEWLHFLVSLRNIDLIAKHLFSVLNIHWAQKVSCISPLFKILLEKLRIEQPFVKVWRGPLHMPRFPPCCTYYFPDPSLHLVTNKRPGKGLLYKNIQGACWKIWIKPLKETNWGAVQVLFDPKNN